jgi:hypothetical protein
MNPNFVPPKEAEPMSSEALAAYADAMIKMRIALAGAINQVQYDRMQSLQEQRPTTRPPSRARDSPSKRGDAVRDLTICTLISGAAASFLILLPAAITENLFIVCAWPVVFVSIDMVLIGAWLLLTDT